MTRAKFKCVQAGQDKFAKFYKFLPVMGGSPENDAFFKASPGGEIMLRIVNDNVIFEVDKVYYVDFTEVE